MWVIDYLFIFIDQLKVRKGVYGVVKFFIFKICVVGKSINLVKLHQKKISVLIS